MPINYEVKFDKLYFKIAEVAEMFDQPTSTIRYWSNRFHLFIKRNGRNDRRYSQQNIEELRVIDWLLNDVGFTIMGAKQYIRIHGYKIKPNLI